MTTGRCPTCDKRYQFQSIDELPFFPFCTQRCRLVDLGRWIDGVYAVPETKSPSPDSDSPPDAEDDSED
jgi:endogenous inhibitor of DNA gyrase (YacG/DUF329 family)